MSKNTFIPTTKGLVSAHKSQDFTSDEKTQARTNIAAAASTHTHSADDIVSGALAKARQHAQTAYLDATSQVFAGAATFNGLLQINGAAGGASTYLQLLNNSGAIGILGSDASISGGNAADVGLSVYGDNEFCLWTNSTRMIRVNDSGSTFYNAATFNGTVSATEFRPTVGSSDWSAASFSLSSNSLFVNSKSGYPGYLSHNATGILRWESDRVEIFPTAASTGVGTGALQVAGGIYAAAASVFQGATFNGNISAASGLAVSGKIQISNSGSGFGSALTNGNSQFYNSSTSGLIIAGAGSTSDLTVTNKSGGDVFSIPAGTTGVYFPPTQAYIGYGGNSNYFGGATYFRPVAGGDYTAYVDGASGNALFEGTITAQSGRPVKTYSGYTTYYGDAGGYVIGSRFRGPSDTDLGFIGVVGTGDTLYSYIIGKYGDEIVTFYNTTKAATFNGTVSALALNADVGSNKPLRSYRDVSYSGWYNGTLVSSNEAYYMGGSGHYFDVGGVNRLTVGNGSQFTGALTVTGILNVGNANNRLFQNSGNLYVESDGNIIFRDTSSSASLMLLANDGRLFLKTDVWHPDSDGNARILYNGSGGATQFYANVLVGGTAKLGDFTVATLPSASAYTGYECNTTDSSVTTFGSTVAGGGSSNVKVRSNGTNWTVTGI